MPAKLPTIYVIAGRNGAGKTTFAKEFLPKEVKCLRFLNADEIARGPCWWMIKMGIALSILAWPRP